MTHTIPADADRDMSAASFGPGSREPDPQTVPALSGFDPSPGACSLATVRDETWQEDHRTKALKLFPNQGLHRQAAFIASLHPHAIQYLELAPVLALCVCYGGKAIRRSEREYIGWRLGPLCERGARLKDVMATFGMPYPLRRLKAASLGPKAWPAIRLLAEIPPSPLALCIPDKGQRKWLGNLVSWQNWMDIRARPKSTAFAWAARELSRAGDVADIRPMVDFICCNVEAFNTGWGWRRAAQERDLWHDRLAGDDALKGLKISPDFQIDYSELPTGVDMCGYLFDLLVTPRQLFAEGQAMRHCVASYVRDVMDGKCNIYSIRQEGAREATLELRGGRISQLKAHCNKKPKPAVLAAANLFVELLKERQA